MTAHLLGHGSGPAEGLPLQFTETMRGFVGAGQYDYRTGYEAGKRQATPISFTLTIRIDDVNRFIDAISHEADASGHLDCELLGGRVLVKGGRFNLFVDSPGDHGRKKMLYRLFVRNRQGEPLTVAGYKDIYDDIGPDLWSDTTTLHVTILRGHVEPAGDSATDIVAAGLMHIGKLDFMNQLATFRSFAATKSERWSALGRFGRFFLGNLWDVYGRPMFSPATNQFEREIPLFTTEGVPDAQCTVHPITTADKLGLGMLRFCRGTCDDVVLIIHGLTTSSDMFIMPEHHNLVTYLLDNGFTDVWTLDYRMSNRLPYNLQRHRFTMDDIALFDYPPALARIREEAGQDVRIHVICHCLGAVSFTMSLFGKAVTGVRSVVANSAALTPRVPNWSIFKLTVAPFMTEYVLGMTYLDPRFSERPGLTLGKIFGKVTSFFHRECDVPACHMLSLMWGAGWPALYNHKNLADVTHRRGGDLYGPTSMHYYRHVRKMVQADNTAVKYDPTNIGHSALPDNYMTHVCEIDTPVLFMTGQENRVFRDSNIVCHERLERMVPGRHQLRVIPGYGHQDVFMGNNVHRDVFPHILTFLNANARPLDLAPHGRELP
ncbi:MAG: alpha/beta fold hydrolase [Nitrospirales bacterium]